MVAGYAPPSAGLVYRWRADSITGVSDGAAVSAWPALTGGQDLAQPTSGSQPTYAASGIGGRPAVRWPSTSSTAHMVVSTLAVLSQPVTIAVVCKPSDTTNMHAVHVNEELQINSSKWTLYGGANLIATDNATAVAQVVTGTYNGGSSLLHVNGAQQASGAGGGVGTVATLNLGRHSNGTRYWRGDIAEVLMYSLALSAGQRSQLHSYVQDRYGITVADFVAA